MIQFKDIESSTMPEERVTTSTIVDINYNIRQEKRTDDMSGTTITVWVCDTDRYESLEEYLSLVNDQQVLHNQMIENSITELTMIIGGIV